MERRIWSIEGNHQKLDGGAMFGNAPRAMWECWAPPDARNRIDLACRCLLVREPDRTILFEAGHVAQFTGDVAKARHYWSRAAAVDPNSVSGKAAKNALALLPAPPAKAKP